MSSEETVPCELCHQPTRMLGTKRYDRCWELERRIKSDPMLAREIIDNLDNKYQEGQLISVNSRTEELLDMMDAAFFTGDSFETERGMKRARYYLARWSRQLTEVEKYMHELKKQGNGGW